MGVPGGAKMGVFGRQPCGTREVCRASIRRLAPNCRKSRQDLTQCTISVLPGSTCGIKYQRLLATAIRLPQLSYAYCLQWRIAAAICSVGSSAGQYGSKVWLKSE